MASERRLRIKTLVMVLSMVVCASVGDLMLKRGMSQAGTVQFTGSGLAQALQTMMTSATIWVGILFLLGFMASQMTVMSWADYSFVMPAGAISYALQTLLAVVILHEAVSVKRWIGVVLICLGVVIVGRTKPRTTETAKPATQRAVERTAEEKATASC